MTNLRLTFTKALLSQLSNAENVWYRNSEPLYDVFEPEFIRPALEGPLDHDDEAASMCRLMFDNAELERFGFSICEDASDPLTIHFAEQSKIQHFLHVGY
jgi:hypothetical protein